MTSPVSTTIAIQAHTTENIQQPESLMKMIQDAKLVANLNEKSKMLDTVFSELCKVNDQGKLSPEYQAVFHTVLDSFARDCLYGKDVAYLYSSKENGFKYAAGLCELSLAILTGINSSPEWHKSNSLASLAKEMLSAQACREQIHQQLCTSATSNAVQLAQQNNNRSEIANALLWLSYSYQNTPEYRQNVPLQLGINEMTKAMIGEPSKSSSLEHKKTYIDYLYNRTLFLNSLQKKGGDVLMQSYDEVERLLEELVAPEEDFQTHMQSKISNMRAIIASNLKIPFDHETASRTAIQKRKNLLNNPDLPLADKIEHEYFLANSMTVLINLLAKKVIGNTATDSEKQECKDLALYVWKFVTTRATESNLNAYNPCYCAAVTTALASGVINWGDLESNTPLPEQLKELLKSK